MGEMTKESFKPTSTERIKSGPDAENTHYHVFCESVPHEYRLLAEQTLGETETSKERGLKKLKEFMKKENLSATDDVLVTVLRACKYNVQKSETKLKKYLRYREIIDDKLRWVSDEKIECVIEDTIFSVLPYRDKIGRTVLVSKTSFNLDKYSFDDMYVTFMCFITYLLTFPMTSICGLCYIGDCQSDHAYKIYWIVKHFKSFVEFLVSSPLRIGRLDLLHENFLIRMFCTALRPILPKKLIGRFFFNGNSYTELHKVYPLDLLPKEFDGSMEPINCKFYKENLMKFIQKMREEGQKNGSNIN